MRFRDWQLRTKLRALGAMALGGLLTLGVVSYLSLARVGQSLTADLKLYEELGSDLTPPTLNIIQMRLVVRNMIMRTDPAERSRDLAEFEALAREFEDSNDHWNQVLPDGEIKELATVKARQAGEQYIQRVESDLYPALLRGDKKRALALMGEIHPLAEANDTATENAERLRQASVAAITDRARSDVSQGILLLAGAGTTAGLAVGLLGFLISRSIVGPLGKTAHVLQCLAAGDLRHTVSVDANDEIGAMSLALNQAVLEMTGTIQSISETAFRVASASEELSSSASQLALNADNQKNQTSQVATALQQMSATVLLVSDNSAKAAEASRKAAETARHGGSIVESTLLQMGAIAQSVRGAAQKVEDLGKSSDQIGRIVGVINDIADQTNLLALNATIEAARAGEQGRGFAVVADEVRKLAERTTFSTKEIAHMVETVQAGTRTVVSAMEQGNAQVEAGVRTTSQAGDALEKIIQMADQVGEMVAHIAAAATQQFNATEEINNGMEEFAKAVGQSADGAQQSAKACQELSSLALALQQMVANFKLPDGEHDARAPRTTSHPSQHQPPSHSTFKREGSVRGAAAGSR